MDRTKHLLQNLNQKLTLKRNLEVGELYELRTEMINTEISHLIGFLFMMGIAVYKAVEDNYTYEVTIMMINILVNMFPRLLQ